MIKSFLKSNQLQFESFRLNNKCLTSINGLNISPGIHLTKLKKNTYFNNPTAGKSFYTPHKRIQNKLIISNYFSFSNMESTSHIINKEQTLNFLKEHGITVHHLEDHEKLETVQAGLDKFKAVAFSGEFTFAKNLFMKSKARGLYLITVHPVSKYSLY